VARGFETFARECFDALSGRPDVHVLLAKGGGERTEREHPLPTLRRETAAARLVGRLRGRPDFYAEHVLFSLALVPLIRRERPAVVLVSEWTLAAGLGHWRRLLRLPFSIVLSNGAPGPPPYNPAVDLVQQVTPTLMQLALEAGEPPERHVMLPYGIAVGPGFEPTTPERRRAARQRLGLPLDRTVVLSVAALNRWLKRIDYLIEEVASLPEPRPHLVLLGQHEDETPGLLALARERLGEHGFTHRTVPAAELGDWYRSADQFVLASTSEGLGRVFLEALAHGLPVLAHDYPITHFVLGGHGRLADIRRSGELARLIAGGSEQERSPDLQAARHRFVYDTFSWDVLAPSYAEMLRQAAYSTSAR
jgi:glycosyltransferase involved in cell wall biosynthesis